MAIYVERGSFNLPAPAALFDVLADGRLITTDGRTVHVETALGSRRFAELGTVASGTPTFLKCSPDGSKAAVGNFETKKVFLFNTCDAGGVRTFDADGFDAEWADGTKIAITAGPPAAGERAIVTVLDTASGANRTIVRNAGEGSGGVTIDAGANLYVGLGFMPGGDDATGLVKAYPSSAWMAALSGGTPIDFRASGTVVANLLSAATLGFDKYGNLHVGGGDLSTADKGYAAVALKHAIDGALAGGPPVTPESPADVLQRLDPSPAENFWLLNANRVTGELYLNDFGQQRVYVFELAKR